jgi:hypothetical protein
MYEHNVHMSTRVLIRQVLAENEMMYMCPQAHEHKLLPTAPLHKNKRKVSIANTPFCYLDKHHSPAVCLD